MEAEDNGGPLGVFETNALSADGNTSIGSDFERSPKAPNIRPPWAARGRPQDGALLLFGDVPRALGGEFEFAMGLFGVAMESQGVDVRVGFLNLSDPFASEIGWKALLPELVLALDFALGLRGWGITEANLVEGQSRAQLGQSVRSLGEEHGVIIDVELEGPSVSKKGGRKEIQVGEKKFSFVEFGTDEKAAAIIEHVEHGKIEGAEWEPVVWGSIELPKLTDLRALPTADGSRWFSSGCAMGMAVLKRPVAYLSAVELEVVKTQGLGSDEAVGARGRAIQALDE